MAIAGSSKSCFFSYRGGGVMVLEQSVVNHKRYSAQPGNPPLAGSALKSLFRSISNPLNLT